MKTKVVDSYVLFIGIPMALLQLEFQKVSEIFLKLFIIIDRKENLRIGSWQILKANAQIHEHLKY
jgi:hypothetical protein